MVFANNGLSSFVHHIHIYIIAKYSHGTHSRNARVQQFHLLFIPRIRRERKRSYLVAEDEVKVIRKWIYIIDRSGRKKNPTIITTAIDYNGFDDQYHEVASVMSGRNDFPAHTSFVHTHIRTCARKSTYKRKTTVCTNSFMLCFRMWSIPISSKCAF